jgi:beta-mannosidase
MPPIPDGAATPSAVPDLHTSWEWACWSCPPGAATEADVGKMTEGEWLDATVPGTAAGTLRSAGRWSPGDDDAGLLDGRDWWFRGRVDAPAAVPGGADPAAWRLELDGLATVADVWLNGVHLVHSENMWLTHRVAVDRLETHNELLIRCAALEPLLQVRRPRPRWRSLMARSQNIRWFRTSLLGRNSSWCTTGAVVGPWRPIRLTPVVPGPSVRERHLVARLEGGDGVVDVGLIVDGIDEGTVLELRGGETVATVATVPLADGSGATVEGSVRIPGVGRWWPHTHGDQPRYPVRLMAGEVEVDLGTVGFRTVEADRSDGGFTLSVNGAPVFCRGAEWVAPDTVTLDPSVDVLRASLQRLVAAGMNMVRIVGYSSYQGAAFWDLCDELGILVWQDCLLATVDPPEDPVFVDGLLAELDQELRALQGRPSLAVVCGSADTYQQPAMYGLPSDRWSTPLLDETLPALVDRVVPGLPYLASSPIGGDLPFDPAQGVSHYYGVGGYLRPVSEVRTAGVRFASECLGFSTPPEPATVEQAFGSAAVAGHHPAWKAAMPRDAGASWDFEDVRNEYVRQVFGIDTVRARYVDPERALDYGRAAVAEVMATALTEWRCERSACAGALILNWQDLVPGAGWGLLDAGLRPKAPWFALARVLAPVTVLLTDDGLSGLTVHVVNDRPEAVRGTLTVTVFDPSGTPTEEAGASVEVAPRSQQQWTTAALLGGFRDLTDAYRFGPPTADVVRVSLAVGGKTCEAVHLPAGPARPVVADLGLRPTASRVDGRWQVTVTSERFAQWVAFDTPGHVPSDSWFHLAPGTSRTVGLDPFVPFDPVSGTIGVGPDDGLPRGRVRALNGRHSVAIVPEG